MEFYGTNIHTKKKGTASPEVRQSIISDGRNSLSEAINSMLLARMNNSTAKQIIPDKFFRRSEPQISIRNYLLRFMRSLSSQVDSKLYIIMLIYIDAYLKHSSKSLNRMNVHSLVLTSLLLACKFHLDLFFSNKDYAKIAGVTLRELNSLEAEFFFKGLGGCHLHINQETFDEYSNAVEAVSSPAEGEGFKCR